MDTSEILRALDAQIAQLQQVRRLLSESASTPALSAEPAKRRGRPPAVAKTVEVKPAGKRTMSEEGKARIAAAQKKRWAKSKKAARAAATPVIAKKSAAPAKKAAGKQAAAPVKAAPAKAATKKAATPAKKAPAKKTIRTGNKSSAANAAQAADRAEPANNTAPLASMEETAAEA